MHENPGIISDMVAAFEPPPVAEPPSFPFPASMRPCWAERLGCLFYASSPFQCNVRTGKSVTITSLTGFLEAALTDLRPSIWHLHEIVDEAQAAQT